MEIRSEAVAAAMRDATVGRHAVSDAVLSVLLEAIQDGTLKAGTRLNDIQLANELGVSRTPVREALQRMKEIGLIEIAPNRFTRVVSVDEAMLRQAVRVWQGLYAVLVREVFADGVPAGVITRLQALADRFAAAAARRDAMTASQANFDFFGLLVERTDNEFLRRGIESVVYIVRLGALSLHSWLDTEALHAAQLRFVAAVKAEDADEAIAATVDAGGIGFAAPVK